MCMWTINHGIFFIFPYILGYYTDWSKIWKKCNIRNSYHTDFVSNAKITVSQKETPVDWWIMYKNIGFSL